MVERAPAQDGVMDPGALARIAPLAQQEFEEFELVIVENARDRICASDARACVEKKLGAGGVGAFDRMIEQFIVIGIGTSLQQQPRHAGVMRSPCGAIEHGERTVGPSRVDPRCVYIGAMRQQQAGAADERRFKARLQDQARMSDRQQGRHGERATGPCREARRSGEVIPQLCLIAGHAGEPGIAGEQIGLLTEHAHRQSELAGIAFECPCQPAPQAHGTIAALPFDILLQFRP